MAYKQLVEYIIEARAIDASDVCPPDKHTFKCFDMYKAGECDTCWVDFLRNRYKNYKG